jgi:DNA-binding CsgD family transcriptional regulator
MEDRNVSLTAALAFLAVVVASAIDLWSDAPETLLSLHVLTEITIISVSMSLAIYLWIGWRRTDRSLGKANTELTEKGEELDTWRKKARSSLDALSFDIDRQLQSWGLTPTEREVALLLLKGHSLKEIAHGFNRSERTVRQHAGAIYSKSGLSGRAELAGFFLGDLTIPNSESEQ